MAGGIFCFYLGCKTLSSRRCILFRYRKIGKNCFAKGSPCRPWPSSYGTPLYIYSQKTLASHFQKLDAGAANSGRRSPYLLCRQVEFKSGRPARAGQPGRGVRHRKSRRKASCAGSWRQAAIARHYAFLPASARRRRRLRVCPAPRHLLLINAERRAGAGSHQSRGRAPEKNRACGGVRINPDVDAHTHAKITTGNLREQIRNSAGGRDGRLRARLPSAAFAAARHPDAHRFATDGTVQPYAMAVKKVLLLVKRFLAARHHLEFFSIGGGLGIVYNPALASGSPAWWKNPGGPRHFDGPDDSYAKTLTPLPPRRSG